MKNARRSGFSAYSISRAPPPTDELEAADQHPTIMPQPARGGGIARDARVRSAAAAARPGPTVAPAARERERIGPVSSSPGSSSYLYEQGRFPFDRLVKYYWMGEWMGEVEGALADSKSGEVIKPILRMLS